jgi:hypothetical protein
LTAPPGGRNTPPGFAAAGDAGNAGAGLRHPRGRVGAPPTMEDRAMDMKKVSGGNLRSVGYDDRRRVLVVELTSGTFEYGGVTAETYRRMLASSSPWSFFRDNIEEEYSAKRVR